MRLLVRAFPAVMAAIALTSAMSAQTPAGSSLGKPITPAEMKTFNTIRQPAFSNDGKWFIYATGLTDSNTTIVLRGSAKGAPETRISAGNGGGSMVFSGDSKWLGYIIAPPRAPAGRGGRGGRGGGADTTAAAPAAGSWKFVLRNLASGTQQEFDGIRRFAFATEKPTWLVMQGSGAAPAGAAAPGAAGAAGPGRGGPAAAARGGTVTTGAAGTGGTADLLLYNLATGKTVIHGLVNQYAFDKDGNWLAYTTESGDKLANAIQLRDMKTMQEYIVERSPVSYSNLSWVDSSRALSVVRAIVDSAGKDTTYSYSTFSNIGADGSTKVRTFATAGRKDIPAGMVVVGDRAPRYSDDMSTLFLFVKEKPKATPAGRGSPLVVAGAPGAGGNGTPGAGRGATPPPAAGADSSVSLILWHYKDTRLQSQQIVQETTDRNVSYMALYRFADDKFIQLQDSTLKTVSLSRNDKYAYGIDTRAYDERASYTGRNYQDVYRVDLATGRRSLIQKGKWPAAMSFSPDGKRLLYWGKDANYWVMDLATGDTVNITKGVPANFADMEDDHNNLYRPAAGSRGWSSDGKYVLLYDDWDIWKVPTTPAPAQAVNLTVNGRRDQIRYQTIVRWPAPGGAPQPDGIDLSQPLYFTTYGEWTKKEGLSRVDAGKTGAAAILFEDAKYSISKARDADVFFFTRGSFTDYPNWYSAGPALKDPVQLTDANPQIRNLAWSSGTRLINYTTDKGDKLQGALFLPANYQPGKKYPMLVSIYELRSQEKNIFVTPSETRAPDPSLFTSRGYAVFLPDIVYKLNDPGMSAVWAVVPAVKAAIATGMIDEKKVGLWGHSWGGYQTAFLVTQTNIFAAAIAGAPLTNMVSMYASVYWNSGGSDAAIFEASQGRFKGNFIENYQAYYRNSPVYFADKMNTPLIILHNDKDGAVDFNQGVTYYNTLRQLGKPVIMLEYAGENHGLARTPNMKDYATRMGEFFDHYLKDATAPEWLKNGIPRIGMEAHLAARKDSVVAIPNAVATDSARAGSGRTGRGGGN